jgi:hypothetical protein
VSYRNDYGRSARALLIAIDGVPAFLECEVPEGPGEVFLGLLEPGLHYVDVVFNFGPGRVGRAPHAVNVNQGKDSLLTIVIDRDDHEHPDAHFEPKQASRARSK